MSVSTWPQTACVEWKTEQSVRTSLTRENFILLELDVKNSSTAHRCNIYVTNAVRSLGKHAYHSSSVKAWIMYTLVIAWTVRTDCVLFNTAIFVPSKHLDWTLIWKMLLYFSIFFFLHFFLLATVLASFWGAQAPLNFNSTPLKEEETVTNILEGNSVLKP